MYRCKAKEGMAVVTARKESTQRREALRFMSGFSDRGDSVIRMAQELWPRGPYENDCMPRLGARGGSYGNAARREESSGGWFAGASRVIEKVAVQ